MPEEKALPEKQWRGFNDQCTHCGDDAEVFTDTGEDNLARDGDQTRCAGCGCPACGLAHRDNRRSQSSFRCQRCLFEGHADHVAAINILAAGRAVIACGGAATGPAEAGTTGLSGLDSLPLQAGIPAL